MAYSLDQLRQLYPDVLGNLSDAAAINKISSLSGQDPQALAAHYGVIDPDQGDISRGWGSGIDSAQAGLYGVTSWAMGDKVPEGSVREKIRDWGYKGYEDNMAKVQLRSKPYDDITQAESFSDVVDSAQYWLAYAGPQIIEAVLGSKGGAFVGKKAVEHQVKKELKNKLGNNTGAINAVLNSKATKELINKWSTRGSYGGIGTQAVATELGHTYGGAVDEAIAKGGTINDVDWGRATKYGLAAGAAEFGADVLTLGLAKVGPAKNLMNMAGKGKSRVRNAATRGLTGGTLEAGTEMVQTGLEEMGAGHSFKNANFLDPTSAWAGFIGGGAMGLAGGAMTKKPDTKEQIDEALEIANQESQEADQERQQQQQQYQQQQQQQEQTLDELEELRDKHSRTFPDEKTWTAEQKAEQELMDRAELADETSELSLEFKEWRKANRIHLSNNEKANDKVIKDFLKASAGSVTNQQMRDAHIAALDAHADLQEQKANRSEDQQALINETLDEMIAQRSEALETQNMELLRAVEQQAIDLSTESPEFMAEWSEAKRIWAQAQAEAEAEAVAETKKTKGRKTKETTEELEVETEETPVETIATEELGEATQLDMFGAKGTTRLPDVVEEETEVETDTTDQLELFVPNPFQQHRTVKGKKVTSKKWQRFEDAVEEFGRDMETVYPELMRAIKNSVADTTYQNKLTAARERKEIIAAGAQITGPEATVLGQVQLKGQWQQKLLPFLLDAAKRGSLEDYMWFDSKKTGDARIQWRMSAISNALGLIDPKTGKTYTPKEGKKLVNSALKAYREKQIAIGEADNIRETIDTFLERTEAKRKAAIKQTAEEETTEIGIEEETAEVAPQAEEDTAAAQDFATQKEGVPSGVRIQDRPSDTGVGAAPAFTPLNERELRRSELDPGASPERSIEKAVARLNDIIPKLKRAATIAENKAKANPKSAKLKKDAEQKRRKADKAIRERESIEDFKEDTTREIRDEYEGTPTPELEAKRERKQQEQIKKAQDILSVEGAKDDVAGEWDAMKSEDMPDFNSLNPEDQYEWTIILSEAILDNNLLSLERLQNSMEGRIRNEKTYSKSKAKAKAVDEKPSADTKGKEKPKTGRKKATKEVRKPKIVEAQNYAREKLGKFWRRDNPRLPKLLKERKFAAFNRLVDKYAKEAEVTTSKMDIDTSQMGEVTFDSAENEEKKETLETMFRRLLGEKGYRKIRKRVYFFANAKEAKRVMDKEYNYDHTIGRESAYVQKWRPRIAGQPDTIVFILNRVALGKEVSTFMHEVGGHIGLDNILNKKEREALQNKIRQWHIEDKAKYGNEEFYDLSLNEILNASDGVIADNPWGQLADSTEHLIARYAIRHAMSEGYIDKTTGEVPADVATAETLAFFIQVGVEIGVRPDGLWSFKAAPEANMVLQKFKQAFKKFLGFMKGDRLDITAHDIMDMAYGAAKIELETGIRRPGQKMVQDIRMVTQRAITTWDDKIDAFVARKFPKNERGKYIHTSYLNKAEYIKFQKEQWAAEKKLRAGLKAEVAKRQRDAARHEQAMQDPDSVITNRQIDPEEKKQSDKEVKEFRDWVGDNLGTTVKKIWDNLANLFVNGTNYTKFLHTFINQVKKIMPAAREWHRHILLSERTRSEIKEIVDKIVVLARDMSEARLNKVNLFIAKSTIDQKWGYNPYEEGDPRHEEVTIDKEMRIAFNKLDKGQKELVQDIFAHGIAMRARKKEIAERIFGKSNKFNRAKEEFFGSSGLDGPYAPLRRFGSHVVELKSQELLDAEAAFAEKDSDINRDKMMDLKRQKKHYEISFHDTKGDALEKVDKNKKKYAYAIASEKTKTITEGRAVEHSVLQKVLASLGAVDQNGNALLDPASREYKAVVDMINDMYLDSLEEENARRSQVKREGFAGYEGNMVRSFISNATAEANLIANMEHGKDINTALIEAKKSIKLDADGNLRDQETTDKLSKIYNMLVSHYSANLNNKPTPFQDRLAAMNTVYMLTSSIGYHITNATQPMMVTIPKLVGDFGTGNYTKALKLYYQGLKIASDVVTFNWKTFKFQTKIDIKKAPKKYQALLRELQLRQLLDVGMEQDLAEFNRSDSGFELVDKITRKSSSFAHRLYQVARMVEAYNRISTATAAFEMAESNKSKVAKMGYYANSAEYAINMVEDTQGNFSAMDAPLILKKAPKITGQYRKYQIMMAWVYADATKKAFAGASLEEKAAGQRTMGFMLGHAALFSGVTGVPFASAIGYLFMAMGEGEEPEDLERWIKENIDNKTLATAISNGLPSIFGIDMSTKLSQDMIFHPLPYTDFSTEDGKVQEAFFEAFAGPFGTTLTNFFRGYNFAKEGNAYRAMEYMLPKGARTAMESYRLGTEGYSLRNGDIMTDDFSVWQLAVNALGIPATDIKHLKWKRGQQYELTKWFEDRQSEIRKQYVKAKQDRNNSRMKELMVEWKTLQKSKDRVRPFFHDERSALKKTPLSSLLTAPRKQQKREEKYRKQLGTN